MHDVLEQKPLISIIVPAFNCERYIEETIYSVLSQTYHVWEIIVIDDGSKDNTFSILEKLSNKDRRIRLYKNEKNLGVSATRNRGIELSRGEWIAFLDSDDMWEETKLEKQLVYAQKTSAEFIFTGSAYINEEGERYQGIFEVPDKVTYKQLRYHNVISCSSVLIKKRLFDKVKFENDDLHEDYAVWLTVLKTGVCAYGVNEPLLIYRISRNSKSGNKIKSLKMTYKVFRFIGINQFGSIYFLTRHIVSSFKKYRRIFAS